VTGVPIFPRPQTQQLPAAGGVPGVRPPEVMTPEASAAVMAAPRRQIGEKDIEEAARILQEYKQGKAALEERVVADEMWYELRHWEYLRRRRRKSHPDEVHPDPTSGWLVNALTQKHADAMDNSPEPIVLPRERSDRGNAEMLSSILPVVLEQNDFEQAYSDAWWEKLKHGTAVYGVFWNSEKENGLGDIEIRPIDLLKIFWEPGIEDVQRSRNLFIVDLVDEDILDEQYPQLRGKMRGTGGIDVRQYIYDESIDQTKKSVVVDWYYRRRGADGRTILHYAKFCGRALLYASENDPTYAGGWYNHGQYPVIFDVMYPVKGTPAGFGMIAIAKDPQLYVDSLDGTILETAKMAGKARFFVSNSTGINEQEFLDWSRPLVHVEGELDDRRIQQIKVDPAPASVVAIKDSKVAEMRETTGARDVTSGGVPSGVTAAAAIAALQEAGNKASRDAIAASYRAYIQIVYLCIELMRQFYDEARSFRITGKTPAEFEFVEFSNGGLQDQPMAPLYAGQEPLFRRPVFDVKARAQRKNPFNRMSQNELAKELYGLGFFNPERAQETLGALQLMDFEGKDEVLRYVQQGQTLLNLLNQMAAQMDQLMAIVQASTGIDVGAGMAPAGPGGAPAGPQQGGGGGVNAAQARAQTPQQGYSERLAARSVPRAGSGGERTAAG
jgi:hypothetical protein